MNRRDFFKHVALGVAALTATPGLALAAPEVRTLWLMRRETGEHATLDLASADDYRRACWLLRDVYAGGQQAWASMGLLRTAAWMQAFLAAYQVHRPFHVHSGYRTQYTNGICRGARASLHMRDGAGYFHAMDIHVNGVSPEYLGRLAALAHQGGVGFYRRKGFVHIDDGRVRYWRG
jgi:uncharacterized protein YcbK (DUF882 family)